MYPSQGRLPPTFKAPRSAGQEPACWNSKGPSVSAKGPSRSRRTHPTPGANASKPPHHFTRALIMAAVLAGCIPLTPEAKPTVVTALTDRSFHAGDPCEAPCWQGLILGISTEEQLLDVASRLSFIHGAQPSTSHPGYRDRQLGKDMSATMYHFACIEPERTTCVAALVADGVLRQVILGPNYDQSFAKAVKRHGAPEFVRYIPTGSDDRCRVVLQWSERGIMAFGAWEAESAGADCEAIHAGLVEGNKIDGSILITDVWYVLPQDILGYEELGDPSYPLLFPWPGFAVEG